MRPIVPVLVLLAFVLPGAAAEGAISFSASFAGCSVYHTVDIPANDVCTGRVALGGEILDPDPPCQAAFCSIAIAASATGEGHLLGAGARPHEVLLVAYLDAAQGQASVVRICHGEGYQDATCSGTATLGLPRPPAGACVGFTVHAIYFAGTIESPAFWTGPSASSHFQGCGTATGILVSSV